MGIVLWEMPRHCQVSLPTIQSDSAVKEMDTGVVNAERERYGRFDNNNRCSEFGTRYLTFMWLFDKTMWNPKILKHLVFYF